MYLKKSKKDILFWLSFIVRLHLLINWFFFSLFIFRNIILSLTIYIRVSINGLINLDSNLRDFIITTLIIVSFFFFLSFSLVIFLGFFRIGFSNILCFSLNFFIFDFFFLLEYFSNYRGACQFFFDR